MSNWWVHTCNIYGLHSGRAHGWRPLPVTSFPFLPPSSFSPFLSSFDSFASSHLVPSGLSLVGVWSINPLNAIKHTMHRRWPFKTNMHSLQTHSCPRAINVISIVYQRPLCEYYGQITLFHLVLGRVIFQRRYKKNCLMLKSSQPLESIRPMSNVGVQFRLLRSIR